MRFTHSLLFALAAPYLVIAQSGNENTFIIPTTGLQATAGEPLSLKWNPTTSGTVSLILRSGSSNNLAEGTTIACMSQDLANQKENRPETKRRDKSRRVVEKRFTDLM